MALTAKQRSTRARIAALERWSREDGTANAERAQAGLRDRFRREVVAEFPDLNAAELERRADRRYRAHMSRIRLAASRKRTKGAA
jgi:hypothetical protein